MSDESDSIYAEIENRKQRAKELGISEFVWDLFEAVRYFPSYSRDIPPGYQKFVPSVVTALEEPAEGSVKFLYDGMRYSFLWSTKRKSEFRLRATSETLREDGSLVLHVNDQPVFELTLHGEQTFYEDDVGPKTWEKRGIEAFVEGTWVEALRELNKRIIQHRRDIHSKLRPRNVVKKPAKLADLKKRFGID